MNQEAVIDVNGQALLKLEAEELHLLFDITQSMYQHMNFGEMVSYVVKRAQEILNSETASVMLYDEATDEFCFSWVVDYDHAHKLTETRFSAHQGIAGRVFKNRRPELILNVTQDPRHYKKVDTDTGFKTKSMLAVPLSGIDQPIGVMQVLNKKEGDFSLKDLNFLVSMSRLIGVALDNARMHEKLVEAYKQLEAIEREKSLLIERAQELNLHLQREVEMHYRFDQVRGNSEPIKKVLQLCEKVIGSDISVLIGGETGTGKGLIARCIHYNSHRRDKPFVAQNCGAVPESLLASELFGYVKGAFTGATKDKRGLFEVADGGTIFLDEVAEMSSSMQVSLLRVLEEGEVRPLGGEHCKKVDVRIISATNRDLYQYVKKGKFREDLFYRIGVFSIHVPPLRERSDDIPVLAQHFLREFNLRDKKSFKGLTPRALDCLSAYSFPGNVRELENEIQRAMTMAGEGKLIDVDHLSEKIRGKEDTAVDEPFTPITLREKIEALEKTEIFKAMRRHGQNRSRAARALGLSRLGLIKKLKRYGGE